MSSSALSSEVFRHALDALARAPKGDVQVASAVVGEVLLSLAEQRSAAVSHAMVDARMGTHGATEGTAEIEKIRPLEVLRRGPRDEKERALLSVLLAQHVGTLLDREGGANTVRALLPGLDWLEFTGPYAPHSAAREALPDATLQRYETLLSGSPIDAPTEAAVSAVRALRGRGRESASARASEAPAARVGATVSVGGELEGNVRSSLERIVSVFTGWSLVRGAVHWVGRLIFSWKRPITVSLDGDLVRVVGHSEVLGRVLRKFDVRYPIKELVEIRREARYPALPAALAVVSLGVGGVLGARAVIEGAGAVYFPLIALGLGALTAGVMFEWLLRALFPGVRGFGRLQLRARDSRAVVLTHLPIDEADKLLAAIDRVHGATGRVEAPATPETAPSADSATRPARRSARPSPGR